MPTTLGAQVLNKVWTERVTIMMVVHDWPKAPCYSLWIRLCVRTVLFTTPVFLNAPLEHVQWHAGQQPPSRICPPPPERCLRRAKLPMFHKGTGASPLRGQNTTQKLTGLHSDTQSDRHMAPSLSTLSMFISGPVYPLTRFRFLVPEGLEALVSLSVTSSSPRSSSYRTS